MYGPLNTNPYQAGSYPAMQNRLNSFEQTYQQQYTRPLSGRIVTGMEEARASQIPLDGTVSYFPSPAENKIYVKSIDMQGLPVFLTYELIMPKNYNQIAKSEQNVQISEFDCRISALEEKVKELINREQPANANVNNAQ